VSTRAASAHPDPDVPLRQRLREALPAALRARDRVAVAALRATLAAIDNAEAVDTARAAVAGLAIEQTPMGEREAAARDYDRAGRPERAAHLRGEAAVLAAHLLGPA
jgi:uncharacterized protein YqeY